MALEVIEHSSRLITDGAAWIYPMLTEALRAGFGRRFGNSHSGDPDDVEDTFLGGVRILAKEALGSLRRGFPIYIPEFMLSERSTTMAAAVRPIVEPLLVKASGCNPEEVARLLLLARRDCGKSWIVVPAVEDAIRELNTGEDLHQVTAVATAIADLFEPDYRVSRWVNDLWRASQAVQSRGIEGATSERELIMAARTAVEVRDPRSRATLENYWQTMLKCADYYWRSASGWVLDAAVSIGFRARYATYENRVMYERYLADFSILLLQQAIWDEYQGPRSELGDTMGMAYHELEGAFEDATCEAIRIAYLGIAKSVGVIMGAKLITPRAISAASDDVRGAYAAIPRNHSARPACAMSLGTLLSQAVGLGELDSSVLPEAIRYLEEAYDGTPPRHPDHGFCTARLATAISNAVRVGQAPPAVLHEILTRLRKAHALTAEQHPGRVACSLSLGAVISQGVQAGIVGPEHLLDSIKYLEDAANNTPASGPVRMACAAALAIALSEAVQAGLKGPASLADAVDLAWAATIQTPDWHVEYPRYLVIFGSLLAQGVGAGLYDGSHLLRGLDYVRQGYERIAPNHPERASCASLLGAVMSDAARTGLLDRRSLYAAIGYQTEAYLTTPESHSLRPEYALRLANHLAQAVLARAIRPDAMAEAFGHQFAAYVSTPPSHPGRSRQALALADQLSLGVQLGLAEPRALSRAADYAREACGLIPGDHPNRADYVSTLANLISQEVQSGLVAVAEERLTLNELSLMVDDLSRLARRGLTYVHRRKLLSSIQYRLRDVPLILAQLVGPEEGLRTLEALRGHLTGRMRAPQLRAKHIDPELRAAYAIAASNYDASQTRARDGVAGYRDVLSTVESLERLTEEVRVSVPELANFGARPRLHDLCAGLSPNTVGIYLLPAPDVQPAHRSGLQVGVAIILSYNGRLEMQRLPGLTAAAVSRHANALLLRGHTAQAICAWLWEAIASPLLESDSGILNGSTEWIFVAAGQLAMLPLHAAGSVRTGWLDDHITVRVSSSLVVNEVADADRASGKSVVAVSAARDLEFLPADRAVAENLIPHVHTIDLVNPNSIIDGLREAPAAVISGHAVHSLSQGGCLAFDVARDATIGERQTDVQWLTAAAVERIPYRRRDWAFLSSCSSGQNAIVLPDEAIGLPSAFKYIGFQTVVATMWPVPDHVAFITLARFLQRRTDQPGEPPCVSLRSVRSWLRAASVEEVGAWLEDLTRLLSKCTSDGGRDPVRKLRERLRAAPGPAPFADPEVWASYGAFGR